MKATTLKPRETYRLMFPDYPDVVGVEELQQVLGIGRKLAYILMKSIQMWMGHSNFSTTADLYAHTDYTSKQRSADTIQNVLVKKKPDIRDNKEEIAG